MPDRTTDPRALRALAHPLRWKLIDLLGTEPTATATRCALVLGESVASCAYHLGILAKYGYTEQLPDQPGREKPWRLTSPRQDLSVRDRDDQVTQLAASLAIDVFLDHELAKLKDRLRRESLEPPEWQAGSAVNGSSVWLTAAELTEIKNAMIELAERHSDRYDHPELRPPGARIARLFFATSVDPPIDPPLDEPGDDQ